MTSMSYGQCIEELTTATAQNKSWLPWQTLRKGLKYEDFNCTTHEHVMHLLAEETNHTP